MVGLKQPALPYSWTQDLETVSVTVPLPPGTRGKDLNVVIEKKKLKVRYHSRQADFRCN